MPTVEVARPEHPDGDVQPARPPGRADLAALAVVVCLPLLALLRGGSRGLWADEAFSASTAGLPTGQLLTVLWERELNGGLYLLLLHLLGLSDAPEWLQRLPTVAAVAAAGWCVYRAALHLMPVRFALSGTVLFLLHPAIQEAAVTVRFYGLVVLAAAALTLLALSGRTATRSGALLYCLLAGLSLYLHVLLALLIATQLAWLVWTSPAARRHLWAGLTALAVLATPLAVFLVTASDGGQLSWKSPLTLEHVLATGGGVLVGPTDGRVVETGVRLLFLVPASAALLRHVRHRGLPAPAVLLLLTTAVPVAVVVLLSFVQSLLVARYLWFVVPTLVMLLVLGWSVAEGRLRLLAATGLVLAAVAGLVRQPGEPDESRSAVAAAADQAQSGDAVMPLIPFDVAVLRQYAPRDSAGVRWAHHDGGDAHAVLASGSFAPHACLPEPYSGSETVFVIARDGSASALQQLAECSGRLAVLDDYPGAVLARLTQPQDQSRSWDPAGN